jgi:hypothetical protein
MLVQKVNKHGVAKVAVLVGEAEMRTGSVTVRCLTSTTQEVVSLAEVGTQVARVLRVR